MGRILLAILCVAAAEILAAIPAAGGEPQPPDATVHVTVLDVSLNGVRKLGFEFRGPNAADSLYVSPLVTKLGKTEELLAEQQRQGGFFTYSNNDVSYAFVDAICKRKLATVVEDTTLKVTMAHSGGFIKAGSIDVPNGARAGGTKTVKYDQTEIMASVTPHDGRALVNFKVRLLDIDSLRELKIKDGVVPPLKVFEVTSTVETKWGQTAVICYPARQEKKPGLKKHEQELQRLVLITPSLHEESPAEVARKSAPPQMISPQKSAGRKAGDTILR